MPEASVDRVVKHLSKITYPKGYHMLEAGKTEVNIFFIKEGIARAYIPVDEKEITFRIGEEGPTVISLESYVNNQQGCESMELMEDPVLYLLKRKDLRELFEKDIHIVNWGCKLAESEFLQAEERLISLLFTTASGRYMKLIQSNPELLQRIPLECPTFYLGIIPISLSQVKAKLKRVL